MNYNFTEPMPGHNRRDFLKSRLKVPEIMLKKGCRIESLTYEVEPCDRVLSLLLLTDKVNPAIPAPGMCFQKLCGNKRREFYPGIFQ